MWFICKASVEKGEKSDRKQGEGSWEEKVGGDWWQLLAHCPNVCGKTSCLSHHELSPAARQLTARIQIQESKLEMRWVHGQLWLSYALYSEHLCYVVDYSYLTDKVSPLYWYSFCLGHWSCIDCWLFYVALHNCFFPMLYKMFISAHTYIHTEVISSKLSMKITDRMGKSTCFLNFTFLCDALWIQFIFFSLK